MKHTTSRKKMLISSVAMLLVAMMALGSATFAWFTSNPKASASGIKLKTTASTGLVVRTDTDDTWSHEAKLYKDVTDAFNLDPVSEEQGNGATAGNFWTITAKEAKSYEKTDDSNAKMTTATAGRTSTNSVYAEKVYFRLSDGSDATASANKLVKLKGVTINANSKATMQNAIKVAIADSTGKLIGTYSLSTAGDHGVLTGESAATGSFSPAVTVASTSLDTAVNATGLSADGTDLSKFVTVYVYLDGQNGDCYSDKVGTVNAAAIIDSIQVDFELVDPAS